VGRDLSAATSPVEGALGPGDRTISSGEYFDVLPFTARRGQHLVVRLVSTDFDAYLIVRTPSGRQFDDEVSLAIHATHPPRRQGVVQPDHPPGAIHVQHINREPHKEHVDRVAWHDEQPFARCQAGTPDQSPQSRPGVVGHRASADQRLAARDVLDANDRLLPNFLVPVAINFVHGYAIVARSGSVVQVAGAHLIPGVSYG
jgi:hypothetical protein